MKTAVDKIKKGKARDVNMRFQVMVNHFVFEAEFCNPASGWEEGQIEKNVQDFRHRLWQVAFEFENLDTKRGDQYLRSLLIQGVKPVVFRGIAKTPSRAGHRRYVIAADGRRR